MCVADELKDKERVGLPAVYAIAISTEPKHDNRPIAAQDYWRAGKRLVLSTSVTYSTTTGICVKIWQECIFDAYRAHLWDNTESRLYVNTSKSGMSLALCTIDRTSGWKMNVRKHLKGISFLGTWQATCILLLQTCANAPETDHPTNIVVHRNYVRWVAHWNFSRWTLWDHC